jgi:hypothetical protein
MRYGSIMGHVSMATKEMHWPVLPMGSDSVKFTAGAFQRVSQGSPFTCGARLPQLIGEESRPMLRRRGRAGETEPRAL